MIQIPENKIITAAQQDTDEFLKVFTDDAYIEAVGGSICAENMNKLSGYQHTLLTLRFFLAPPYLIGTPTYYQWRHDNFLSRNPNATPPDYYLNYGFKYAQKFQNETNQKLSPQGQKWTGEVMTNLQILLENRLSQSDGAEFERNAQALKNFAFTTHVEAYWNENGTVPLYALTFTDLFRILFTPDFRDVVRGKSLSQIVMIVGKLVRYRLSQFVIRKLSNCCSSSFLSFG